MKIILCTSLIWFSSWYNYATDYTVVLVLRLQQILFLNYMYLIPIPHPIYLNVNVWKQKSKHQSKITIDCWQQSRKGVHVKLKNAIIKLHCSCTCGHYDRCKRIADVGSLSIKMCVGLWRHSHIATAAV